MEESTIDLKDILRTIRKHVALIAKVTLGTMLLALLISFVIPPTYEAETDLRIKQPKGLANSLLDELPMGNGVATKQLMSTYAEILKSRTVIEDVISKTQIEKERMPSYEDMLKRITTQPVKDTEILKVRVKADSPQEAEMVANVLVESFNARMTYLVRVEQSVVREFIGQRLDDSKKDLEKAESQLEKYKRDQKIVNPETEIKAVVEKMAALDKLTAENKVAIADAQGRLKNAQRQLASEAPGFIADSPLIQQYKGKLAEQEVQLVSMTQKYTTKHPDVLAVQAAINETRSKLEQEAERIVTANAPSMNPIHQGLLQSRIQAEAEYAARTAQSQAISRVIEDGEQQLTKLPSKEQGLVKVMRDASVAQEIYIMLAKRYEEARINEVMQPTDVQVIDVAIAPEKPINPKKALNTVIGAVLGLIMGIGSAFYLEYMNKTIRNKEDVEKYLALPLLGSIPDFQNDNKLKEQDSFFSRVFNGKKKLTVKGRKHG